MSCIAETNGEENYLADRNLLGGSFGGAMVVSSDGAVVDSFPLGKVGMLLVDL